MSSEKSSLTAVKDDKENKEMHERKKWRKRKRGGRNEQKIMLQKRTRLYLNQRHSHKKDDSGIHDNPVFAGLIILSDQD